MRWVKMGKSLSNYQAFINKKEDRFRLGLVDLLYISNFKGGNGAIHEHEEDLAKKLVPYSNLLVQISLQFGTLELAQLSNIQTAALIGLLENLPSYTSDAKTSIDGFKISYLSALYHAYFPNLIPILDRRVLIGTSIITKPNQLRNGQVIAIHKYFPELIMKMQLLSRSSGKSLRELDGLNFEKALPPWAKPKLKK